MLDEVLAMKMQLENYLEEARAEASQSRQRNRRDKAEATTEASQPWPLKRNENAEATTEASRSYRHTRSDYDDDDDSETDEKDEFRTPVEWTPLKLFEPCIVVMKVLAVKRIDGAVSLTLKGTSMAESHARVSNLTKPELVVVTSFVCWKLSTSMSMSNVDVKCSFHRSYKGKNILVLINAHALIKLPLLLMYLCSYIIFAATLLS